MGKAAARNKYDVTFLLRHPLAQVSLHTYQVYNPPESARASAVSKVSSRTVTPPSTVFSSASTARMRSGKAVVNGVVKTTRRAPPKIATATVTVARISTMMRPSSTPTAVNTSWRFSKDADSVPTLRIDRFSAVAGASAFRSFVVAVTAAVMRLICSPTRGTAAAFSSGEEDAESGARVASG